LVNKYDAELDAARRKAFIVEADLWSSLSNPNLLKLYGACHVTIPPFFVCEESREGNLSKVLKRSKSKMWRLLHESALAIRFLHDKIIVHGDLKLNNILVGADGCARVADFGMSRFKKRSRNLMLTDLDPLMGGSGALRWCAPEALEAKAQIQSDVYSFAMCLVEAISGEIPYHNVPNDDEVRDKIRRGELPEQPDEMDDGIWELVKKMTVSDRLKRVTIKEVIPELKKRADADLNNQVHGTLCRDCGTDLEAGSSVCQACKPSANKLLGMDVEELHRACREGDVVKVQELLEKGNADVNHLDLKSVRSWSELQQIL
jgi:serine/threonine protein kinase